MEDGGEPRDAALDHLLVDDVGLVDADLRTSLIVLAVAIGVVDLDHQRRTLQFPEVGGGQPGEWEHRWGCGGGRGDRGRGRRGGGLLASATARGQQRERNNKNE